MGWGDVRAVADGGGGDFRFEPGVDEVGYEAGSLFGGTVADAGKGDELRVLEMAAKLGRGVERDGPVGVTP